MIGYYSVSQFQTPKEDFKYLLSVVLFALFMVSA